MQKKCDVCGNFYMPYNNNKDNDDGPNGFRLLREDKFCDVHILYRYECCPNCMNKILTLVESLKVHTDDVNGQAASAMSEYDLNDGCSSLAKAGITLGKD